MIFLLWIVNEPNTTSVAGLKKNLIIHTHSLSIHPINQPKKKQQFNTQHFFIVCIPLLYTHYIYHFQGHWFTLVSSNEKNNVFNLYTQRT